MRKPSWLQCGCLIFPLVVGIASVANAEPEVRVRYDGDWIFVQLDVPSDSVGSWRQVLFAELHPERNLGSATEPHQRAVSRLMGRFANIHGIAYQQNRVHARVSFNYGAYQSWLLDVEQKLRKGAQTPHAAALTAE